MDSPKIHGVSSARLAEVRRNIERFLDKHTREGGVALQHNMAARPAKWQIIDPQPDPQDTRVCHPAPEPPDRDTAHPA